MHLVLTGATGLVGSAVLHAMLTTESITQITILSRRPVPMASALESKVKVKVILHTDYTSYPAEILEQLKDAHGVVWAQGCSQNDVDKKYGPAHTQTLSMTERCTGNTLK
jgi:uncharacterized protein YbjT (DUF2867 family)